MKSFLCSALLFFCFLKCIGQEYPTITLQIKNYKKDTINAELIVNYIAKTQKDVKIPLEKDVFRKKIQIEKPTYIQISDNDYLVAGYIERNDNITICFDAKDPQGTIFYNGKGSGKFELSREINLLNDKANTKINVLRRKGGALDAYLTYMDSVEAVLLGKLEAMVYNISSTTYNLLKGEVKGAILYNRYYGVERLSNQSVSKLISGSAKLSDQSKNTLNQLLTFNDSYYISPAYLEAVHYILGKEYDGVTTSKKTNNNLGEKYQYLSSSLPDHLKIPVLTMFLRGDLVKQNSLEALDKIIQETFATSSTSEYKKYVVELFNRYKVGKKAPNFSLEDREGKKVTLHDLNGKVVYMDFWFSGCTPCHNLFNKLAPVKEYFKNNKNVVFMSVSIDNKEMWIGSLKKYGLPGYHVFTEGQGAEHPIVKSYGVKRFPTTYLLDKNGNFYSTTPPETPQALIALINKALDETDGKIVKANR